MAEYVIQTANVTGTGIAIIPASAVTVNPALDDSGSCSFKTPSHDPAVTAANLAVGRRDVRAYRDGQLVYGGPMWGKRITVEDGMMEPWWDSKGWLELLLERVVVPTDVIDQPGNVDDLWDRFWEIFAYAESLNPIGLTRGFGQYGQIAGFHARYAWYDWASLASIIADKAENAGRWFDFWIEPDMTVRTRKRPGAIMGSPSFSPTNIVRMELEETFDNVATQAFAVGKGSGTESTFGEAHNSSQYTIYRLVQQLWSRPGTCKRVFLDDYAQAFLERHQKPTPHVELEVEGIGNPFDLELGKRYHVAYQDGPIDLNDDFRLLAFKVEWQDSGREKVTVTMDTNVEYWSH